MKNKLLILEEDAKDYAALLKQQNLSGLEIVSAETPEEGLQFAGETNIILGRPAYIAALLNEAEQLSWVQSTFAGIDALCMSGLRTDYTLTGIKKIFGPLMSEYVMSYILSIERSLFKTYENQSNKIWDALPYRSVNGLTMGIIGLGSIGQHVARTASHFGMRVLGLKRSPGNIDYVEHVYTLSESDEFLKSLDYLVAALPATSETEHFINDAVFEKINSSAIFINIGRGVTVDETALINALQSKSIKGAVLDVFETEPLPQDSPLWGMENVIITPHNSAESFPEDILKIFCENYKRFISGQPLNYVVDFKKGY
ncbi:MAG: D-2-hydroxyacid dehydrogenase [Desulfobacterales bacterium]|nr:D-2-hydroxyacid dehydrogenase [Desulfobacterales bacterium]